MHHEASVIRRGPESCMFSSVAASTYSRYVCTMVIGRYLGTDWLTGSALPG